MSNVRTCTHIKVSGVRCGSPALREHQFCYFHQRMHRGVRTPTRARLHPIALIEDGESIQMALMEVINGLMRDTLDLKRATLILRALHIAVKNAYQAHFDLYASDMVKQIPEYDDSEVSSTETGIRDLEIPIAASTAENARVGADALVRRGGPQVRSKKPATTHAAYEKKTSLAPDLRKIQGERTKSLDSSNSVIVKYNSTSG